MRRIEFRNLLDFGILGALGTEIAPLRVGLSDVAAPRGHRWQCLVLGRGGDFDKGGMA